MERGQDMMSAKNFIEQSSELGVVLESNTKQRKWRLKNTREEKAARRAQNLRTKR